MTSLIESYEKSYKNDPFFSSGVQYVTKEGVKEEEEGGEDNQSDQYEEGGDKEGEQGVDNYCSEEFRGENLLLLAGIPVYHDPTYVHEDRTGSYHDPAHVYEGSYHDPTHVYEGSYQDSTLSHESSVPVENLLLAPIPEYEVRACDIVIVIVIVIIIVIVYPRCGPAGLKSVST